METLMPINSATKINPKTFESWYTMVVSVTDPAMVWTGGLSTVIFGYFWSFPGGTPSSYRFSIWIFPIQQTIPFWLVVSTPLYVSWDDDIPNRMENKKSCSSHHQPVFWVPGEETMWRSQRDLGDCEELVFERGQQVVSAITLCFLHGALHDAWRHQNW